jgi:hypothetical protein
MSEQPSSQRLHQVLIDGKVIYTGDEWEPVFFEASSDPKNGVIEHTVDGHTYTLMGPNVRLTGGIAPHLPPVQSVHMTHPGFMRGYHDGLATLEPHVGQMSDKNLVDLLTTLFTSNQTEHDLYYHLGSIIGTMDAQTQLTLYRVVSVSPPSRQEM